MSSVRRSVVRPLAVGLAVACALLLFGGGALAPSAAAAGSWSASETAVEEAGETTAVHRRARIRRLWRPRATDRPRVTPPARRRTARPEAIPPPSHSFAAARSSPRRGPPLPAS